jgi:hypothetical protein
MSWVPSFIICTICALVNLPFVMEDGGSMINLISMIFCGAVAVMSLAMMIKTTR